MISNDQGLFDNFITNLKLTFMRYLKGLSLVLLTVLFTQCYPGGPEYTEDLDLVYTNYDQTCDFTAKHTYAIPDQIPKVTGDYVSDGKITYVNDVYAKVILDLIKSNLNKYGWTEVDVSEKPDVLIAPLAGESTTFYYSYYYYYDWWYGSYYPGYGGGWYYPYPTVDSYTTGTLWVSMLDANNLTPNDKFPVSWTFLVNGLLEGSSSGFQSRASKTINQAFEQSPYLDHQ